MTSALCLLTSEDLSQLAGALRSGRLLRRSRSSLLRVRSGKHGRPCRRRTSAAGMRRDGAAHLADCLEMLCQDRRQRPVAEDLIDLVWTGPEAPGIVNRDTSVVVREMFQNAKESVLVAGYAVYQGHVVFKALAERMDRIRRLSPDVPRYQRPRKISLLPRNWSAGSPNDSRDRSGRASGSRSFYDPRSLETEYCRRASLHAKCVVVDKEQAFVSSANFTEAAQTKNIEVGLAGSVGCSARRLYEHFDSLAAAGLVPLVRLP